MKRIPSRRGALLIDILIALVLSLIVGAALATLINITYYVSRTLTGQNSADTRARNQVDTLADQLRNAQSMTSGSVKKVFSAAAASDLTCYLNSTGDTQRFWLDTTTTPPTFKRSQTLSGVKTTTVLLSSVSALQFTYYQQAQANYTAASSAWSATASPHAPTAAELPNIGAVSISVTVTTNSYTNQISTFVRLRNSPLQ